MNERSHRLEPIATHSPGEGLDFGCHLLAGALSAESRAFPHKAPRLLIDLAEYIEFRYVGEFSLALEQLTCLGNSSTQDWPGRDQFWRQLDWVASQLGAPSDYRSQWQPEDI